MNRHNAASAEHRNSVAISQNRHCQRNAMEQAIPIMMVKIRITNSHNTEVSWGGFVSHCRFVGQLRWSPLVPRSSTPNGTSGLPGLIPSLLKKGKVLKTAGKLELSNSSLGPYSELTYCHLCVLTVGQSKSHDKIQN